MKLAQIRLENYRRFDDFQIHLHPELTVIAARNGQGKTTVLEAIAAALGPFVGAFDMGRAEHIRRTDARYSVTGAGFENEQNFPVLIDAILSEPSIQWQRVLRSAKSRTSTKEAADLARWGQELQAQLRHNAQTPLPVIRYYSSKRLWVSHKNTSAKATLTESRTAGYEDCLSSLSSFVQLQEWMRKASLAAIQQREQPGYENKDLSSRLQGIADAVDIVMSSEGWRHFHYSLVYEELAMVHSDHGALPISLLSDGVRAMISLAADLALRCVRLNGFMKEKAPLESSGIVLIDEVDLHLHPAWQQQVLQSLRNAFPRLQFIVSSHSPQVLSTVARSNIRVLFKDADEHWQAQEPEQEVLGMESAVALNEVMGVNPVPPVDAARLIADYTAAIESGQHDSPSGKSLRQELLAIYGNAHPVLMDADRLIRFQGFKLRQPSRAQGQV
ncbi:putative ATP-binding protein involved in virulence [Paucibacter oligotrophus]|uniref:Putative ATP-binding protein involved in virulence n=1 Tax=Roseateles oligotrophus TaxID=1769250 RepID=A0A840L8R0_9BURK|nr:AAA family ATPase [Roseateles oligotrophus]MBB4842529.1 putative ATP-binding protein involved in virulence [Roseateles oligotrophus]